MADPIKFSAIPRNTTPLVGALIITVNDPDGSPETQGVVFSNLANNMPSIDLNTGENLEFYNTADKTTNYERGYIKWDSNILKIGVEKGGTGTNRGISILSSQDINIGTAYVTLGVLLVGAYPVLEATSYLEIRAPTTYFGAGDIQYSYAHGEKINFKALTELTTILAAGSTDTTIQIPANVIVKAVSVRVVTVIPTATTFTVIGATSTTAFNTAAVSTAVDSTDKGNLNCPYNNGAAQSIRITPDVQPGAATGQVRVTIWYEDSIPPTS